MEKSNEAAMNIIKGLEQQNMDSNRRFIVLSDLLDSIGQEVYAQGNMAHRLRQLEARQDYMEQSILMGTQMTTQGR